MGCRLPDLPDFRGESFLADLIGFGHFLENNCRLGCCYDFGGWPNPVWQLLEAKLLSGLSAFAAVEPADEEIVLLQWYNSGILIKTAGLCLGFDLLPVPRYYNWPDTHNFTDKLAKTIDALFVTHNHADHFDSALIEACARQNKPVFMHPAAIPSAAGKILPLPDLITAVIEGAEIVAHHGCHVWRNFPEEVATTAFEVRLKESFSFVFCGDLDYTKGLKHVCPEPDVLFITWRNPGPKFEDGHPEQVATTIDAVNIAFDKLRPRRIILEHYGELDHIYKGFSASFDLAARLIESLSVKTDILFWGDCLNLRG